MRNVADQGAATKPDNQIEKIQQKDRDKEEDNQGRCPSRQNNGVVPYRACLLPVRPVLVLYLVWN